MREVSKLANLISKRFIFSVEFGNKEWLQSFVSLLIRTSGVLALEDLQAQSPLEFSKAL